MSAADALPPLSRAELHALAAELRDRHAQGVAA